jgi:hypothetical protein
LCIIKFPQQKKGTATVTLACPESRIVIWILKRACLGIDPGVTTYLKTEYFLTTTPRDQKKTPLKKPIQRDKVSM